MVKKKGSFTQGFNEYQTEYSCSFARVGKHVSGLLQYVQLWEMIQRVLNVLERVTLVNAQASEPYGILSYLSFSGVNLLHVEIAKQIFFIMYAMTPNTSWDWFPGKSGSNLSSYWTQDMTQNEKYELRWVCNGHCHIKRQWRSSNKGGDGRKEGNKW